MQEWKKIEDNKEQIEREKINTELSFLKSQINPHFFFNTLNNIYSLAITESKDTASAVMKLSSIMRYVLTDTQNNKVPLQSEVDFITNYIDLQLVRLTDKVKVDFLTGGVLENKQIAPLLFIPFIENAFKYGISTKDESAIEIKLVAKNEAVHFSVINTIVKSGNIIKDTTGIGINNVKRRLELLYQHKHKLTTAENNNQFIVHLDIDLT
ncbi:MAG TPA: sensor histidine kinase [Chitinophagaceae bacterium]|nr:sensor histidine kinase [Chitinophagaceae bacterium]